MAVAGAGAGTLVSSVLPLPLFYHALMHEGMVVQGPDLSAHRSFNPNPLSLLMVRSFVLRVNAHPSICPQQRSMLGRPEPSVCPRRRSNHVL